MLQETSLISSEAVRCSKEQVFRRIAVPKFQGNRFVLNNMTGCGYLNAICHQDIAATARKMKFSIKDFFSKYDQIRNLQIWSHLLKKSFIENFIFCVVSLSHIIRRSDFQAKILKEIHNNYYELQEYNIYALRISATADRNTIAIFCFAEECHCRDWKELLFFKQMNFNGHEFFRTLFRQVL